MNTVIEKFSNLFKINRNRCYSFSCHFPIRYVNGCPESKNLSLKYQHLQLKSKHCYLKKNTLPWMKIWRWRCKRYLRYHGFLQCENFECLKFRHTKVIHKKRFLHFVEMHNYVWYLWTCPSQNTGLHNFEGQISLGYFWGKIDHNYFCQSIAPYHSKMLKWKKTLQRIIIRFSNFGPTWDNIGGFSLMRQGIGRSPALAKNLLILFPTTKKNHPISRLSYQITKYQIPCLNQMKTTFLSF